MRDLDDILEDLYSNKEDEICIPGHGGTVLDDEVYGKIWEDE